MRLSIRPSVGWMALFQEGGIEDESSVDKARSGYTEPMSQRRRTAGYDNKSFDAN